MHGVRRQISLGRLLRLTVVGGLTIGQAWLLPQATTASTVRNARSINLVGYSTPGPVYGSATTKGTLEYAFAHTKAGKGATFLNTFGSSDTESTAVADGLPADVVNFSYGPNVLSLVAKKLVSKTWDRNAYQGMVTDSIVAFGVRHGNPKHIKGWADLTKHGVSIVTPSTSLSGSAKWNILAAYGYASKVGKHKSSGLTYLKKLAKNVTSQPTSGSRAVAAFLAGEGDVVIGYEDDLLAASAKNPSRIRVVIPAQSLLIQNPLAWTLPPASHDESLAKRFVSFLYSKTAQTIWGKSYYMPVVSSVAKHFRNLRKARETFNIRQLGGWSKLGPEFFGAKGYWTKDIGG